MTRKPGENFYWKKKIRPRGLVNPASLALEKRFFTGTNSQKVIKIIDFLLIISSGLKTGIDFLDILIDFFDLFIIIYML